MCRTSWKCASFLTHKNEVFNLHENRCKMSNNYDEDITSKNAVNLGRVHRHRINWTCNWIQIWLNFLWGLLQTVKVGEPFSGIIILISIKAESSDCYHNSLIMDFIADIYIVTQLQCGSYVRTISQYESNFTKARHGEKDGRISLIVSEINYELIAMINIG